MVQAVALRPGMSVVWKGDIYLVVDRKHITPGNKRSIVQASLKNVRTGQLIQNRFRSVDSLEIAHLEPKALNFLYSDVQGYHFMNMEDWSQEALSAGVVGRAKNYLKENLTVEILFHEDVALQVRLPAQIDLAVAETAPGVKGNSVTNTMKPAVLESGLSIQVPLFIKEGELIRVDTRTGKYLGRA